MDRTNLLGRPLTAFWAIARARFLSLLQYRTAAAAGAFTQIVFGLIRIMIFEAFYRSSVGDQPLTLEQTITYIWLGQALFALQPYTIDADLRNGIMTGGVVFDLVKPLNLHSFWLARSVSNRLAPCLLRILPVLIFASFYGLKPPAGWYEGCAFGLALFGALAVSSGLSTLISTTLIWTIAGDGVSRLFVAMSYLFSGLIIPLALFPDWAQSLLAILPFRAMADTPFNAYLGRIPPNEMGMALAHQWGWAIGLTLLGRWITGRAVRRIVTQGG